MSRLWSKADLHVHTRHSDGIGSVEAVLAQAARTDLRLLAITDHDTIDGALEARSLAQRYSIQVIVGEEVSTCEGHLLALFIERWLPPGRPAAETIAAIHAQGGLCLPAHPYDWATPSMGRAGLRERAAGPRPEWPIDGIECFNASLWPRRSNAAAALLATQLGVAACGGSDSHSPATVGCGYTLFQGETAEELRCAILERRTQFGGRRWPLRDIAVTGAQIVQRDLRSLAGRGLRPST